jgi:penicillin V acylase-like amidase (Ntn superfamily)
MELLYPLNSKVVFFNRGDSFSSHMPDGFEAVWWENKYGFVGLNGKGLSLSGLWLPGTEYEQVSTESDPTKVYRVVRSSFLDSWKL